MHANYLAGWVTNHLSKNWDVGAKGRKKKEDDITLYSDLDPDKVDIQKARDYNISTYGTHNPTAKAKSLNIDFKTDKGKKELADRYKENKDLIDTNNELKLNKED
jgi:hypothetical protein